MLEQQFGPVSAGLVSSCICTATSHYCILTFSLQCLFLALHCYPIRGDTAVVIFASLLCAFLIVLFLNGDENIAARGLHDVVCCTLALITGTVLFRISAVHPLSSFPGPFLNRISSWPSAYAIYTGYRHLKIASYHDKYGEFVRTGACFF